MVFNPNAFCSSALSSRRYLCLACMLEAVRAKQKTIDIEIVNRVLLQPHWRKDVDLEQF